MTAASAYSSQSRFEAAATMLQAALVRAPEARKALIIDALNETRRALAAPPMPSPPTGGSAAPTQAEIVLWKTIEKSTSPADFSGYLAVYPNGLYAPLAKARLDAMRTPQQKAADIISQIHGLVNGATLGKNATQNVFVAGCLLSVARPDNASANYTIDLRRTDENLLSVQASRNVWGVFGLASNLDTGYPRTQAFLFATDQAAVAKLYELLPQAVKLCKTPQ